MPKRQPVTPTTDWQQLELRFTDPTQRTYELIRPVVLFGQSPVERAREATVNQRMLYRHVERFTQQGMLGLDPTHRGDTTLYAPGGAPSAHRDLESRASTPAIFETPYRSPQLPLWEWGEDEWYKVLRLPAPPMRRRSEVKATQESLDFGT